jgi:hypothetical protein
MCENILGGLQKLVLANISSVVANQILHVQEESVKEAEMENNSPRTSLSQKHHKIK